MSPISKSHINLTIFSARFPSIWMETQVSVKSFNLWEHFLCFLPPKGRFSGQFFWVVCCVIMRPTCVLFCVVHSKKYTKKFSHAYSCMFVSYRRYFIQFAWVVYIVNNTVGQLESHLHICMFHYVYFCYNVTHFLYYFTSKNISNLS